MDPLIQTKCHSCREQVHLQFIKAASADYFKVLFIGSLLNHLISAFAGKRHTNDRHNTIICPNCLVATYVDDDEVDGILEIVIKAKDLEAKRLTEDEFKTFVKQLNLRCLNSLEDLSRTWSCECGEEVPMNFTTCWKCGAESDHDPIQLELPGDVKDYTHFESESGKIHSNQVMAHKYISEEEEGDEDGIYFCEYCEQPFEENDIIYINNEYTCEQCKPKVIQKMKEG